MKTKTVFCLSDSCLTIYACSSSTVSVVDTFEFADKSSQVRFSAQVDDYKIKPNYLLLDLSCEDYHQEQLPHVIGGDRKRLIKRKLEKLFPSGQYSYADHVRRLKLGRYDDIYSMSGIADSSPVDPAIDFIVKQGIEIAGVYSLPLLAGKTIQAIVHKPQTLVVSCDEEHDGRYVFRQSFVDEGHLIFSRQTSILTSDIDKVADRFRKEIERTWQYLNNKKTFVTGERMEVLMVLPPALDSILKCQASASHCDYLYVDSTDLYSQNGCDSLPLARGLSALGSFLIAKQFSIKSHYKPMALNLHHKHQKINRALTRACVPVVALMFAVIAHDLKSLNDIEKSAEILKVKYSQVEDELKSYQERHRYVGVSPQEMQSMVDLRQQVGYSESLPGHVFTVISKSFSNFDDLNLSKIKWRIGRLGEAMVSQKNAPMGRSERDYSVDDMGASSDMDSASLVDEARVIISIEGTVNNFAGDYRGSIELIESLKNSLSRQDDVESVVVTKLPLDIDSNIKASRSLSSQVIPGFSLDVTLIKKAPNA